MGDFDRQANLRELLDELRVELSGYMTYRLRLFKLDAFEKGGIALSYLVYGLIVFILFLIILFFLLFGIAFLIGDIMGNNSVGFGILFLASAMVLIIVVAMKKRIRRAVLMKAISLMRKIDSNEEE